MRSLTLTDPDTGQQHAGQLPEGWHEVPLSSFLAFHQLHAGHAPELAPVHAVQVLSGLPADLFAADVSLAMRLAPALAWYFDGLPAGDPAPVIEHLGVRYQHVGDFERLTTGQFEALLAFRDAAQPAPIHAAPQLLAVLYQPTQRVKGQWKPAEQTAATVAAAAEAFRTLPVSVAWPVIANFLTAWGPLALRFQACSVARTETMAALTTTQAAVSALRGASRGPLSRTAAWLASRYVSSVAGRLRSF